MISISERPPIIEIQKLTKDFGSFRAVDSLDLVVREGDVFGFLGPNGAGKSTTIRMMLTLISPTSGDISIFGKPLVQRRAEIMRNIGCIVEKPDFYLYLSAFKNLEVVGRLSGADISKKHIMETLAQVGLEARAYSKVKTFSYGMKQRLGIAQALLHDPQLIILDEPTNGLDPAGVKEIRDLILDLCRHRGKTVFLSSHILSEVEMIANRMAIVHKGKTLATGEVSALLQSGVLNVRFSVDNAPKAIEIANEHLPLFPMRIATGNTVEAELSQNDVPRIVELFALRGISIFGISSTRSLEDYFLKITGEAKE